MCGAILEYFGIGVYDLNLQKIYLLRVSIPVPSLYVLKVSHPSSIKASVLLSDSDRKIASSGWSGQCGWPGFLP
jgi:hypothetical protein